MGSTTMHGNNDSPAQRTPHCSCFPSSCTHQQSEWCTPTTPMAVLTRLQACTHRAVADSPAPATMTGVRVSIKTVPMSSLLDCRLAENAFSWTGNDKATSMGPIRSYLRHSVELKTDDQRMYIPIALLLMDCILCHTEADLVRTSSFFNAGKGPASTMQSAPSGKRGW